MLIYAHRGSSNKLPENTMEAFEKALDDKADGIELDVQLSADGIPVIIHDENLKRLTGEDLWVKDLVLKDLYPLNVLDSGFKIPTLVEYLDWVSRTDLVTNIELKTSVFKYEGLIDSVAKLVRRYFIEDKIMISSFNHLSLKESKELLPSVRHAALEVSNLVAPEEYLANNGFEYYHPLFTTIDRDLVKTLDKHDIKINAWTVDSHEHAIKLKELGIEGIITNVPHDFINL